MVPGFFSLPAVSGGSSIVAVAIRCCHGLIVASGFSGCGVGFGGLRTWSTGFSTDLSRQPFQAATNGDSVRLPIVSRV